MNQTDFFWKNNWCVALRKIGRIIRIITFVFILFADVSGTRLVIFLDFPPVISYQ